MAKKILLFLITFLILLGTTYAELNASAESVENSIYLDEHATYYVFVENTNLYEKNLNIYTTDIKWYVDAEPSPTNIPGLTKKKFEVTILPSAWAETGSQSVKVIVESPNTNEKVVLQLPVFVKDYDIEKKEYSPSVELKATFEKSIDPRNPIPLELYIRNRNRLNIEEMELIISSSLFSEEKLISLEPMSETRQKLQYTIEPDTKPVQDSLTISLRYKNKTVNKETILYEVVPYSDFVEEQDNIQELFKHTTDYVITNEGNVKKKGEFRVKVSVLQNLFIQASPRPFDINLKEQYYEWMLDLQPNEKAEIKLIRNYRPALYILLMTIVVILVYFLYRSPLLIKKESIVIGSTEEGISQMKVLLHLRNRSADLIGSVSLTDLIPPFADLINEEHVGTLSPTKILKHHKKGTIIKWDFEAVEPFEERIISYRIKTRMTIVGGFILPRAKLKFVRKDTERTVKSNKSQVSLGL